MADGESEKQFNFINKRPFFVDRFGNPAEVNMGF